MTHTLPRIAIFLLLALALCLGCGCQESGPAGIERRPTPAPRTVVTELTLGVSVQGRPIRAVRLGDGSPAVLVIAGTHGDEPAGCYLAEQVIAFFQASPGAIEGRSIVIVPQINPDGCAAHKRANAHGVDLNRNLPATNWKQTRPGSSFGGDSPQSEPETAALVRLIDQLKPTRIISIHSITRGRECNNYDGPARDLAEAMSELNSYPARASIGYPTPGSLGSWAGHDRQIPMITLELPSTLSGEAAWIANRRALLLAIGVGSEEPGS